MVYLPWVSLTLLKGLVWETESTQRLQKEAERELPEVEVYTAHSSDGIVEMHFLIRVVSLG